MGAPPFMVRGYQGERDILDRWEHTYGLPVVTSGVTQVEAMKAFGVKRIVGVTYFPDDALDAERLHGLDLRHAGGDDRQAVGVFPAVQDVALALVAADHERRRAHRGDEIHADLRQLPHPSLDDVEGLLELMSAALRDPQHHRDDADAFWQQPDDVLEGSGTIGRHDQTHRPTPAREGHCVGFLPQRAWRCVQSATINPEGLRRSPRPPE